MSRVTQFLSIPLVLLLGYSAVEAQIAESVSNASVSEQLRQVESKRRLARQEIAQLDDRVAVEVQQIISRLDDLFRGELVQKRFEEHYAEAEEILQKVSLPADVGFWEVTWKQWRNPEALEALVEPFVADAQRRLEPAREALESGIAAPFEAILKTEMERAQQEIRDRFQGIVSGYFPVWEGHTLIAPPLTDLSVELGGPGASGRSGALAVIGTVGAALLIGLRKKIVKRIGGKLTKKIAGRVAANMIPIIGTIISLLLVAWDIKDIAQAKVKMENELRTQFAVAYASQVTPAALWEIPHESGTPSFRQELVEDARSLLHVWAQHCRQEVHRMLDAARISTLSPKIKAYIEQQEEKGRNTQEVAEEMILVGEVFEHHIIARTPVVQLLDMIIDAPDRRELSLLARALDNRLLREYEQHGREVLIAAHTLGVDLFLEVMDASVELDWADAQRAFEQYPHDMNEQARRGLLLLLSEELEYAGVPPSILARITRHEAVFRTLVPVLLEFDQEKLFEIFAYDQVVRVVEKGYAQHADVMDAFVQAWPARTWRRYEREGRLQALFTLAAYRMEERRQSASNFATDISERDELTPMYEEVGLDGLRLWDAYVTPSTGEHQRRLAEQAISLYKAGYPREGLSTREGLELAASYNRFPLGLKLYNFFKPLGKAVYLAVVLLAVLIVAVPLLLFLKVGRKFVRIRPKRRAKSGEASPADSRQRDNGTHATKQEFSGRAFPATAETDDETSNGDKQDNRGSQTPPGC